MSGGVDIAPGVDGTVGQDRVPALPDRRGALVHLVQPRRHRAPQQHQVGLIDEARVGESGQDERRAQEPGAHPTIHVTHQARQRRR